jgi:hypothetical protein
VADVDVRLHCGNAAYFALHDDADERAHVHNSLIAEIELEHAGLGAPQGPHKPPSCSFLGVRLKPGVYSTPSRHRTARFTSADLRPTG